ncbi:hypothetical protein HWD32_gp74 [Gordonia phage Secretariat]|uniref:Uncharacterized protein n=1 Tax=Gordonia phage Secretariat TaxID=2725616 RepID=A0A6M3SVS5_9CAUD|nr:hypothetical protein HWD32_gp74 [Gordonia phage Secretariat]QJD49649.1 hypothetical protein SEA_SECRETARIAT_74 [Gordonia phage Secretariat]
MTEDILTRKREAHRRLALLVQELTEIHYEENPDEEVGSTEIPTAWVLCVGYEAMSNDPIFRGTNGPVIMFPKDDQLPGWKVTGILSECMSGMDSDRE